MTIFPYHAFTFSRLGKPGHGLADNLLALLAGILLSFLLTKSRLRVFPNLALSASQRREIAWREAHNTTEQILTKKWHSFDRHSPELGWELKPNIRSPRLNSNSKGIRGTREYLLAPPDGARRVLCIGDSFMFGENLSDEQTLPAQLESILNKEGRWEVLNLAGQG